MGQVVAHLTFFGVLVPRWAQRTDALLLTVWVSAAQLVSLAGILIGAAAI